MRFYFVTLRGTGTPQDPYRCPFRDFQADGTWNWVDGREYAQIEDGWGFVWTNNSDADHVTAIAQSDVTYLPIDAELDQPVSVISVNNRTELLSIFANHDIPVSGINGGTIIRDAIKKIFRRAQLNGILYGCNIFSDTYSTVGDIPVKTKKAMNRGLTNHGFDISGITNATTINNAVEIIISQSPANFNWFEAV